MLRIVISGDELFNEEEQTFSTVDDVVVDLEHSLYSLSKWESEYQKPFLSLTKKTPEETFGYLKCMVVSPDVDPDVLYKCSNENISKIQAYIDSKQTATTFGVLPERRGPGEIITSELIYYWMVSFNIPVQFEHWHLNRLFALVQVCNIKNNPGQKMNSQALARQYHEINERRKKEWGTNG